MDGDPWFWTVQQVSDFFNHQAHTYINDMPNSRLPDLPPFLQILRLNDVCGAVLLTAIDAEFLRTDCSISSLGVRSTIIHCIRKLCAQSTSYRVHGTTQTPLQRALFASPPETPVGMEQQAAVLPNQTIIGQNVRDGEHHIEDARGRKRRKLDLTTPQQAQSRTEAEFEETPSGFLKDSALPVDEIFFGKTLLGHEIGSLDPDGNIAIPEHDRDGSEDNFQFQVQDKTCGERRYVWSQLRHFLFNETQVELQRRGRQVLAILPYQEGLVVKARPRSAIVFQVNDELKTASATRENAAFLNVDHSYNGLAQTSTSTEWDFLLAKHKDPHELPAYQGSLEEEISSSLADELDAEEEERAREAQEFLTAAQISEVIDDTTRIFVDEWKQEKLPRLEEKQAWRVWKQTKRSKTVRDILMEDATAKIAHLERRLDKYKANFRTGEWHSERDLRATCEIMRVTAEDREEFVWKKSVWARRKEPDHQRGHRKGAVVKSSARPPGQGFTLWPDDRLSVSPNRDHAQTADTADNEPDTYTGEGYPSRSDVEASLVANPDEGVDQDSSIQAVVNLPKEHERACYETIGGDVSHDKDLPNYGFPTEARLVTDPEKDAPDPEDLLDGGVDRNSAIQAIVNLPKGYQCACSDPIRGDTLHDEDLPSSPPVPNRGSSAGTGLAADPGKDTSDSESLPEVSSLPSALPKPRSESKRTPTKLPYNQGWDMEPIDLTMTSSDSSSPLKKFPLNKPRPQADYSSNPYEASLAQVKAWDINEIAKRADRIRLLIKLLQLTGDDTRETLYTCYRDLRRNSFRGALVETLRDMREHDNAPDLVGPISASAVDPKYHKAMERLAEIAVAWLLCDPGVIKRPLEISEWTTVSEQEAQFENFVDQVATVLSKRHSKLFQSPRKPRIPPNVSASDDETDDTPAHLTPHKTRKKHVPVNRKAREVRDQALKRQEEFRSAMASQSSNSQELVAMLGMDPNKSEIVINLTRKEGQEPVYIHPNIAQKIKAHQIDGVRFMWHGITNDGQDGEQGCILAHTMGLGKTMQTIALLIAVNEAALSRNSNVNKQLPPGLRPKGIQSKRQLRMLILSPSMLLPNWRREIVEWAGQALGNVFVVESALSNQKRMDELESWHRLGGVLLISYDLFRAYIQNQSKVGERDTIDQILLQDPELVVADEAHCLKNKDSKMAQAAGMLRTRSRIALTGTPMSNNTQEIYVLISFVAPGYLGEPNDFSSRYAEPIKQGTYVESTAHEVRTSRKKLEMLRLEIEPKVNRANITVLRGSLKPKVEFVITLPLTPTQQSIFNTVIDVLTEADRKADANHTTVFGWLAMLTVLTNHPVAFRRKLLSPPKGRTKPSRDRASVASVYSNETGEAVANLIDSEEELEPDPVFSEKFIQTLTAAIPDDTDPKLSAKASIFFDILDLSRKCGDKVLAFSSSIPTLDYLSESLEASDISFVRIDGKVQTGKRLALVEKFNNSSVSVMLISTKAGSTGLNIQAANRVVIFDFGFNPSWEEQAIGRVYRLGQTKPVHVYRFVSGGTFEEKVYERQLFKQGLTLRVVDKQNPRRNVTRDVREFIYKPREVNQQDLSQWVGKDPNVLDQIIHRSAQYQALIRALSTMETLQEDAGDMPLTEEDWRDINEHRGAITSSRMKGKLAALAELTGPATISPPIPPSTAPVSASASALASALTDGAAPFRNTP